MTRNEKGMDSSLHTLLIPVLSLHSQACSIRSVSLPRLEADTLLLSLRIGKDHEDSLLVH